GGKPEPADPVRLRAHRVPERFEEGAGREADGWGGPHGGQRTPIVGAEKGLFTPRTSVRRRPRPRRPAASHARLAGARCRSLRPRAERPVLDPGLLPAVATHA